MSTRNQIDVEAQKDPAELEREIDQQRAEIGNIVHALESKLSPGELIDTALGYMKGGSGEFFSNLSNTVKANPVPTVLTSIGLLWMMAGQNRQPHSNVTTTGYGNGSTGPSMGEKLSAKTASLKEQGSGIKDKASQMSHSVSESLGNARTRASDSKRHASERLRGGADRARGGFNHLLQEQPLALGAIGIALGALLAASVPPTRREDEALGEMSDRVTDRLRHKAEEGYQKVSAKGEEVAAQVKQGASNGEASRSPSGTATSTGSTSAGL
ncbi:MULTISPECIES: DUF3618 domain-containing protein [Pseudomonadaceae]|jgi:ElaB/YqjD/DUF883 family membrane-anchored ribosome-binding protein|uniref:DUF3618 domain-containing protein n=1 Tax=Stutzerimonas stutzeri TaxID=316 RepID=A0A0D9APR6_STUST|nr:DUF3618 domain-containing protein [Stutzerimonas stutzeri]KJH83003.1 hypothetical protein UF78_06420 [Stutzerimonas stutzeri]